MILWIMAGYVVTAVAFYSYIVSTAQDEPQEKAATLIELGNWHRSHDEPMRKVA